MAHRKKKRQKKQQPQKQDSQAQVLRRYLSTGASAGYRPRTLGDAMWDSKGE